MTARLRAPPPARDRGPAVEWRPALPRGFAFDGAPDDGLAVQPAGFLAGAEAAAAVASGAARPVAGGPVAFSACVVVLASRRGVLRCFAGLARVEDWMAGEDPALREAVSRRLGLIAGARASFAGLALDRPRAVGVINVTPDSFSDGGDRLDPRAAVAAGLEMAEAGADLVEVGGESTRPGARPVPPDVEAARILPVVEALAGRGVRVSVDTRRAAVMEAALRAGAAAVNDVGALADPESCGVIVRAGCPAVLMHMQGAPATMQDAPAYRDAAYEVYRFLDRRVRALEARGHSAAAVDPGIGFGKDDRHNAALLAGIGLLHATGRPVVLGASRKGFIARASRGEPPKARLAGSIAALAAAALQGVQMFRVHDVAETRQALSVLSALAHAGAAR